MYRRGFTLTELVVVIGIVAILYAFLAPVLFAARIRARETQCTSNLRQTWTALLLYRDDYGEFPNFRPSQQLRPAYVRSPGILFCPLEYRTHEEQTEPPGVLPPLRSSYMWGCIPSKGRDEAYARRGEDLPAVICPVHTGLSTTPPRYHVLRYSGAVTWVPLQKVLESPSSYDW